MGCSACPNAKVFAGGLCSGCYHRKRRRGTVERKNCINRGACTFPGCDRQSFAKNLCTMHYQQAQHPLRTLWRNLRSRAAEGYPRRWERFDAFLADVGERPSPKHQLRRFDPTAPWSRANMVWREPIAKSFTWDRKAYMRAWDLRKKYGLTVEQVEQMARDQGGRCPCCRNLLADAKTECVDHDHVTRAVRGLLCDDCNKAIGLMRDDPARLRAAADYLDSHSPPLATAAA